MKSFKGVVILSALLPILGFTVGLIGSYFLSTPAAASVVCVELIMFIIASVISWIKKLKKPAKT